MSDSIEWSEMTLEQRNRLIHEKVMGVEVKACDGGIGEQANSPDGWYCLKCGYSGHWGDEYDHEEIPRPYTTSIGAAWLVVEKMVARMGWQAIGFEWDGPRYKPENRYFSSSQHIPGRVLTWNFDYTKNGGFSLDAPCWYVNLCLEGAPFCIMADTAPEAICLAALYVQGEYTDGEVTNEPT